tara:strand:+ start:13350 stop:13544 length:195 start_codon:yes stop_codon:yes gene_type:complete
MSNIDNFEEEYNELICLMKETTEKLKRMTELQVKLRLQFGDSIQYLLFLDEMDKANNGWISSGC